MKDYLQELLDRSLKIKDDGEILHFEHVLTFFSLAIQTKSKKILELGVRDGGSTYPLLAAAKVLNGHVTSVDLRPDSAILPNELKENRTFIQSDAIKFLEENTEKFDLIYVDDWHSYSHVKKELELIDKISDETTLILVHDLMGMSHHPNYFYPKSHHPSTEWGEGGPYRAVEELDKNKWEWMTIPVNHGLTLLRKKSKVKIS